MPASAVSVAFLEFAASAGGVAGWFGGEAGGEVGRAWAWAGPPKRNSLRGT